MPVDQAFVQRTWLRSPGCTPILTGMDALNPSAAPTFATGTPLHIAAVGLNVRDLDRTTAYYRDVIGLAVLERTDTSARLGAGGVPLLELTLRAELQPDDPRSAGLYHTAYLMPTRADLARWVMHVAEKRAPIVGASDHGVSEAFYLDDPEGNGVEVYAGLLGASVGDSALDHLPEDGGAGLGGELEELEGLAGLTAANEVHHDTSLTRAKPREAGNRLANHGALLTFRLCRTR